MLMQALHCGFCLAACHVFIHWMQVTRRESVCCPLLALRLATTGEMGSHESRYLLRKYQGTKRTCAQEIYGI